MLTNRFGCRTVAIVGTIVAAVGFIMSIFAPNIYFMYFSFGIVAGENFEVQSSAQKHNTRNTTSKSKHFSTVQIFILFNNHHSMYYSLFFALFLIGSEFLLLGPLVRPGGIYIWWDNVKSLV